MSTKVPQNSKTNTLIKDGDFPNSKIAPLRIHSNAKGELPCQVQKLLV